MAATLWLTDGHISHTSAGALFRLDGIPATDDIHMTIPPSSRQGRTRSLIVHRSLILANERRVVDGLRCTSPARTLVDCAAMLDDEEVEAAYEAARRMGLATANTVARAADAAGRRPGVARIRRILTLAGTMPAESRLEVRLARLLRDSDLPASVAQFRLGSYRLDRAWPRWHVGVEADGFQHHGQRLVWKRDRRRLAEIEAAGWRLVHVTWDDVTKRPEQTLDRIRMALHTMAA